MLKDAVRAKFDILMSWDVSRLGRSLTDLVNVLDDLHSHSVDLYLHQQAVDTTTPTGKAMYQMTGVFAEFERSMISERVKAGLQRAKDQGKKLGRPENILNEILIETDRHAGLSIRQIAGKYGISIGKAHKVVRGLRK
ncbi:MAG: recombinase family protein, partial [Mesorhizobium sp.]